MSVFRLMEFLIFQNFLALTSEKQKFHEIVEHGIIEFFGADWKENKTNMHCQVKRCHPKCQYISVIIITIIKL